jgi:hypothetical protein
LTNAILDRVIWIALSVGIAILTGVTSAYLELQFHRAPAGKRWWDFLRQPWFTQSLRLIYALGIPAFALFWQGLLTYRGMGFKAFPWTSSVIQDDARWTVWQHDIEMTCLVTLITWLILHVGVKSSSDHHEYPRPDFISSILTAIRESLIDQVHWAFYRELCIILWGLASGSWIVILLLSAELLFNPITWTKIKHQRGIQALAIKSGILFASTILFIETQNIWLMGCMEFTLTMLFSGIIPMPTNEDTMLSVGLQ